MLQEWNSQLAKSADAWGIADIIHCMWRISLLCRSDIFIVVKK